MNRLIGLIAAAHVSGKLFWRAIRSPNLAEEEGEGEPLTKQMGALVVAHKDDAGNLCVHLDNDTTPVEMKFLAEALAQQAQFKEYVADGVDRLSDSIRDD